MGSTGGIITINRDIKCTVNKYKHTLGCVNSVRVSNPVHTFPLLPSLPDI